MSDLGLHLGERDIVSATLDDDHIDTHDRAEWHGPGQDMRAFVDRIVEAVGNLDSGHLDGVWIVLPPGYIHLRRVPLEIAGDRDRQRHLAWEAAQTLSHPTDDLVLRHWASGSSAIWEAVRADLVDRLAQQLEDAGHRLGGVCAEPVALYHALLDGSDTWRAGVALSKDWISVAAGTDNALVLAESIRIDAPSRQSLEDLADLVASRIRGRAERYASFAVAGQDETQLEPFAQHLGTAAGMKTPLLGAAAPSDSVGGEPVTRIALAAGATRSSRTGIPS